MLQRILRVLQASIWQNFSIDFAVLFKERSLWHYLRPPRGRVLPMPISRVEVTPKQGDGMRDVRGDVVRRQLMADHGIDVAEVRSINGFLIKSAVESEEISKRVDDLFSDPIIEHATTNNLLLASQDHFQNTPDAAITIGFKPGVTDNPGSAAYDGFKTIFSPKNELEDAAISTYQTYVFY